MHSKNMSMKYEKYYLNFCIAFHYLCVCVCVCPRAFASVCAFLIAKALKQSVEDNLEEIGPIIPHCGF